MSIWCGGSGTTSRFLLPFTVFLLLEAVFKWAWRTLTKTPEASQAAAPTTGARHGVKADASASASAAAALSSKLPNGDVEGAAAAVNVARNAAAPAPSFEIELDGDHQLRRRPIGDLVEATKQMVGGWTASFVGASFNANGEYHVVPALPVVVAFSEPLDLLQLVRDAVAELTTRNQLSSSSSSRSDLFTSEAEEQQCREAVWQRVLQRYMPGGTLTVSNAISSQFASAVLMAAPLAANNVSLTLTTGSKCNGDEREIHTEDGVVSLPYLRMTQRLMEQWGFVCKYTIPPCFRVSPVWPEKRHRECDLQLKAEKGRTFTVEGDASSASYFFGLAAVSGGQVTVNINRYLSPKSSLNSSMRFPLYRTLSRCWSFVIEFISSSFLNAETETSAEAVVSPAASEPLCDKEGLMRLVSALVGFSFRDSLLQGDTQFPQLLSVLGFGRIIGSDSSRGLTFQGISPSERLEFRQNALVDMRGVSDCLPTLAAAAAAASTPLLPCRRSAANDVVGRGALGCTEDQRCRLKTALMRDLGIIHQQRQREEQPTDTKMSGGQEGQVFDCFWTDAGDLDWRYLCLFGLGGVKFKETNRLDTVASQLQEAGYTAWCGEDYLAVAIPPVIPPLIQQQTEESPCNSFNTDKLVVPLKAFGDHRLAMAWAILGIRRPDIYVQEVRWSLVVAAAAVAHLRWC